VSINIAQLPDLYTLTLALSRMRERGCGHIITGGFYVPAPYDLAVTAWNQSLIPVANVLIVKQ
jgi:hypothetical protein